MYDIEPLSCGSASRAYEVKNIGVGELASCKMSDCGSWKSSKALDVRVRELYKLSSFHPIAA